LLAALPGSVPDLVSSSFSVLLTDGDAGFGYAVDDSYHDQLLHLSLAA